MPYGVFGTGATPLFFSKIAMRSFSDMSAGSLLKIDLRADFTGFGSSFFGGDLGRVNMLDEIAGDLAAALGESVELALLGAEVD